MNKFARAVVTCLFLILPSTFASSQSSAEQQTITIGPRIDYQQIVVANLTAAKGAQIAYGLNASAVVNYSIQGYANYGAFPPLETFFTGSNSSADGVFIAPFDNFTYRLALRNPSTTSSVQVSFYFQEMVGTREGGPAWSTGELWLLAIAVVAAVIVIGMVVGKNLKKRV